MCVCIKSRVIMRNDLNRFFSTYRYLFYMLAFTHSIRHDAFATTNDNYLIMPVVWYSFGVNCEAALFFGDI